MKLFFSSTGLKFSDEKLPPRLKKIKKVLDGSRDGELFSTVQICSLVGVEATNFRGDMWLLPGYTHRVGNKRYYGKPRTINQLKKETSHDDRKGRR